MEEALVGWMAVDDVTFRPIHWQRLAEEVYLPNYEAIVGEKVAALEEFNPVTAAEWLVRADPRSRPFAPPDANFDEARAQAAGVLGAATIVALTRRGWRVEALPGGPVACVDGDRRIEPFAAFSYLAASELSLDEWRAACERAGIADVPLSPAGLGQGPRHRLRLRAPPAPPPR